MKMIKEYKQIVASATLLSMVFGLLVVCHSYFVEPVLAATVSDEIVRDIMDNNISQMVADDNGVCQDEQAPIDSPITSASRHHQKNKGGLMPCCYEKAPSNSNNQIEVEPLFKVSAQPLFFIEPEEKTQITSFNSLLHGPPISAADLSSIIVKRE